ncbi:DUF4397 domain-containing protein [Flavobacterium rhizosphaerae]|uniref:DUF4397 domain-containing protein n=1 Tax=Flavobacterium rhizosphaerae TaxID=3163298 RepID=A0ABW8Z144_9FLAO
MTLRFLTRLALGLTVLFTATSCITDDDLDYTGPDPYENVAFGAIVNASPSSGDIFFFADENQVYNGALRYGQSAGYYNFFTGDRNLSIINAVGDTLATNDITLEAGDYFSAFAVNTFDNIELVTYRDSLQYPANGKAMVRFINLSPDAPALNIATQDNTVNFATGLTFKAATSFMPVMAGTYTVTFSDSTTDEEIYTESAVEILEGRNYTIYTKGFVTPPANSNDTFSTDKLRNL